MYVWKIVYIGIEFVVTDLIIFPTIFDSTFLYIDRKLN